MRFRGYSAAGSKRDLEASKSKSLFSKSFPQPRPHLRGSPGFVFLYYRSTSIFQRKSCNSPAAVNPVALEHLFASVSGQPQVRPPAPSAQERLAFLILALLGNKVVATVKGGTQYSGILATATAEGEFSIALRQVHPTADPTAPVKPSLVILARDLFQLEAFDTNIEQRAGDRESFKTDTDISGLPGEGRREKELQAWGAGPGAGGAASIGSGANEGLQSLDEERRVGAWDQFATNEKLYGTRTDYHEDIYTTKLDRSGSDYSAKEKRAAQLEREILKGTGSSALASNAHMAEERGAIDDSGLTEEDRYGSVIRGPEAYVPPGARKGPLSRFGGANSNGTSPSSSPKPLGSPSASAQPFLPKIAEPTAAASAPQPPTSSTLTTPSSVTSAPPSAALSSKARHVTPVTLESNFRNFVTSEKARLTQKREQIVKTAEKKDQDSRLASLLEFSHSFVLKTPMPEDMASIGRDNTKKPFGTSNATTPAQSPNQTSKPLTASHSSTPISSTKAASTRSSPIAAKIAEIPPFKPKVPASAGSTPQITAAKPPVAAAKSAVPPVASTSKINPNAPVFVFKPNPNASSFTPSFAPSPSRKPAELPTAPANPFFGSKQLKKGSASMHVKEDFTPFKNGVVPEASTIQQVWPFTGKSYRSMFPDSRQGEENNDLSNSQPPHLGQGVPMHPIHPGPPPPQGYSMYQQYQPNFNPRFQPQPPNQPPMQHMPPQMNPNGGNIQYTPYPPMGFSQSQGPPPHGPPMYTPSPQMQSQQQPYMRYAPFPPQQQQPPNGAPIGFQDPRPPMSGP